MKKKWNGTTSTYMNPKHIRVLNSPLSLFLFFICFKSSLNKQSSGVNLKIGQRIITLKIDD